MLLFIAQRSHPWHVVRNQGLPEAQLLQHVAAIRLKTGIKRILP